MFKPNDRSEAEVFAFEGLRADVQYDVLRGMQEAGISKAALAREMNVSAARVSQLLDDDANLTLETIAKIFVALGRKPRFVSEPAEATMEAELADHIVKMAAQESSVDAWFEMKEGVNEPGPIAWERRVDPSVLVRRSQLHFDEIRANDNYAEPRQLEIA
jgi:plasmid maintenance system antidote protein VapI